MKVHKTIYLRYFVLLAFILVIPAHSMTAQDSVRAFTIKEAQDFALENNLNIRNARLDVEHAKKVVWENLSLYLPQVNSGINYNNNLSLQTSLIPAEIFGGNPGEYIEVQFGTQHNATASITATQMIINMPYIIGLQAASVFKSLSEQNLEKTEIEIRELIAQNYYLALLAEESYEIIDSNYQNVLKTIQETEKLYETGFVEEMDVDNLRVTALSLESSMKSAERQIELAYRMLKYQLGIDLNMEIELAEDLPGIIREIDRERTVSIPFQVTDHIDYKLLDTQEELAFMNLKRQKMEYIPSLDVSFLNNWMAMRNQFDFFSPAENWYYSSVLGFTLNIPIFSSGNKIAKVSERKIEYEKAVNAKKLTTDGLILQHQQARADFISAYDQYLNEKENIKISAKVLEKTRIKVREGMASSLDFTQVNSQYLQTETNYISAMVEMLNAKLRLDKALNRL